MAWRPALYQYSTAFSDEPRLGAVVRQQLRAGSRQLGELLLQHLGDAGVEVLAAGFEQGAVGGVLDQRVLEAVGRLGRRAAAEDQLGRDQLVERGSQLRLRPVGDRGEQRVGELAADRGADLRDLLDRREAVEAGEQRVVERRGNRERRQRPGQLVAVAGVLRAGPISSTALVSSSTNSGTPSVLATICAATSSGRALSRPPARPWPRPRAGRAGVSASALTCGCAGPRRAELRPEGDDREHRQALDALDRQAEQLLRGRVDPVHVLVGEQHRLLPPRAPRAARPALRSVRCFWRCGVSSSGG